jgi:hypothetical protein
MPDLDDDDRVGIKTLCAIAIVILGLGAIALWGPWTDLQETSGYGIGATAAQAASPS